MKKTNAWLKKFFGIGAGADIEIFTVTNGDVIESPRISNDYKITVYSKALKDGSSVIVDHVKKTVTFKMI